MTTLATILFSIAFFLFDIAVIIALVFIICKIVAKIKARKAAKKEDPTPDPTPVKDDTDTDKDNGDNNTSDTDTDSDKDKNDGTSEVKPCACTETGALKKAEAADEKAEAADKKAETADEKATKALEVNQATAEKVEKLSAEQRERYREATKDKRDSLILKIANLSTGISIRDAAVKANLVIQGQLVEAQNTLKEKKEKADNIEAASAILHDHSAINNASVQRTVRPAEGESEEATVKVEERLNAAEGKQNSKLCDHQNADENSAELAKEIAELQKKIDSIQEEITALNEEIITLSKELNAANNELEELDKPLKA